IEASSGRDASGRKTRLRRACESVFPGSPGLGFRRGAMRRRRPQRPGQRGDSGRGGPPPLALVGGGAMELDLGPELRAFRCCLGFSEAGHGSDLAGVETRGEVVGDELVVSGAKTWVAGADRARTILVLCRTDPDAPRYEGLTCVAVPLHG